MYKQNKSQTKKMCVNKYQMTIGIIYDIIHNMQLVYLFKSFIWLVIIKGLLYLHMHEVPSFAILHSLIAPVLGDSFSFTIMCSPLAGYMWQITVMAICSNGNCTEKGSI